VNLNESVAAKAGVDDASEQFLTFLVGREEYGVDILRVQEIKAFSTVTAVPNTPAYIRGVMNLRGTVVPVIDLRVKFGLANPSYDKFTVIVVVKLRSKVVGLVVDAVSDVLDIRAAAIEQPPELVTDAETAFIRGMATIGERLVMLVDVDQVIALESLSAVALEGGTGSRAA
jgi:purine-binding chemotaxis protein CheW